MKELETHTVNVIVARNSYIPNSPILPNDADGDNITFGEKPTKEPVKEIVILINPKLELSEVHRLLSKVVNQIEMKISNGQKEN